MNERAVKFATRCVVLLKKLEKNEAWLTGHELAASVMPYFFGAWIVLSIVWEQWDRLALFLGTSFALAIDTFLLHRTRRQAIAYGRKHRKALQARYVQDLATMEQLRKVALSALALKIMIEHGFPANLNALNRDLAAVLSYDANVTELHADAPEGAVAVIGSFAPAPPDPSKMN
jgi:hypothetical protein